MQIEEVENITQIQKEEAWVKGWSLYIRNILILMKKIGKTCSNIILFDLDSCFIQLFNIF